MGPIELLGILVSSFLYVLRNILESLVPISLQNLPLNVSFASTDPGVGLQRSAVPVSPVYLWPALALQAVPE